jgi:hypothetical protein
MTTMWKVVYGSPAPVEVEADIPSFPHKDSAGDRIYENTHFLTLDKAWSHHIREHRAGLSLGASDVTEKRRRLLEAEHSLANVAIVYNAALRAYEKYLEGK